MDRGREGGQQPPGQQNPCSGSWVACPGQGSRLPVRAPRQRPPPPPLALITDMSLPVPGAHWSCIPVSYGIAPPWETYKEGLRGSSPGPPCPPSCSVATLRLTGRGIGRGQSTGRPRGVWHNVCVTLSHPFRATWSLARSFQTRIPQTCAPRAAMMALLPSRA